MATKQAFTPKSVPVAQPEAFENEIPTYRAYSAAALASAGCGLLSALSFVSYWWLVLSVLAIVLGVFGAWRIHSMPATMTGRSFAHAGIAMGLIFGASSYGYDVYSTYALRSQSRAFADDVIKTFNNAKKKHPTDTADVLWWMMPPHMRQGKVPADARAEIAQITKSAVQVQQIEEQLRLMASYAGTKLPIQVLEVEEAYYSERDAYASILVKVGDGQDHSDEAEAGVVRKPGEVKHEAIGAHPELALLVLHGVAEGPSLGWYVQHIQYPYTPKSYKPAPTKPVVDDGHGHAH